jgi:hypothetical protein
MDSLLEFSLVPESAFAPSHMSTTVLLFVSFEVRTIDTFCRLGFLATFWHWALIAVIWMETVIYVTTEEFDRKYPVLSC